MLLRQIFDPYLAQYAYLIGCQQTREALIIDPERDIDRYLQFAQENGLRITAATETHIHADFVSGLGEFARNPDVDIYLSAEGGPEWKYTWPGERSRTHLVRNGDHFQVGKIRIEVIHTPGHTPEHVCFLVTDIGGGANLPLALVSGDFLFVGDVGRPDLLESAAGIRNAMEPSARALGASLRDRLAKFEDYLQIFPAHGAGSSCGKSLGALPSTTLGYERRFNKALKLAMNDDNAFVKDILTGQPDPPLYFATMKRVNRDGAKIAGGIPTVSRLAISELLKLTADPTVKILDTRNDRVQFDSAHVPRSINAPLRSSYFFASAGSYLSDSDRVLLVLENEADADLAIRQLYRIGLDQIVGWTTFDEIKSHNLATAQIRRIDFSKLDPATVLVEGEILDVRTAAEFERSHLNGAKSFPYTRLKARLGELEKSRRLFVHCGLGQRATMAASFLSSSGFDVVHVDGNYAPRP